MTKRKRLGTPVDYPEGHPYADPRERAADAVGMLNALHSNFGESVEDKVREFAGFMWAVEGRELSSAELAKYRLGLTRGDR